MYRCSKSFHSMYFLHYGHHQNPRTDHPPGDVIPIIAMYSDDSGCSCILHTCCREQVQLNAVLSVCREQIHMSWGEETAMCYIIKDGIDQCHNGFLRHSCTKFDTYDGVLIQVVNVILPDDTDTTRRAKFYHFCVWAYGAVIGVTKHHPSSGDRQDSRMKKTN